METTREINNLPKATDYLNDLASRFGVWVIGGLAAMNLFFVRGLVQSIEESSRSVSALQSEMREIRGSTTGLLELRIDVATLKNKVDDINRALDRARGNK